MVSSIGRLLKVKVSRRCDVRKQPKLEKTFGYCRYVIEIRYRAEICWVACVETRFFEKWSDNSKLISGWEETLSKAETGQVGNEVGKH